MPEETQHNGAPAGETRAVTPERQRSNMGVPVAIVLAALLIAGAIYLKDGGGKTVSKVNVEDTIAAAQNAQQTPEIEVDPVTAADHVRGNPDAPIVMVEYSDYDCPFCKNFHETMTKIMDDYGKTGKVAWVYRHLPLEQLHPNAPKLAVAAECVANLGKNEAFWKFTDQIFASREVNEKTDLIKLPEFAVNAGVSKTAFSECLEKNTFEDKVKASIESAVKAGARGTPYTIVMVGDEKGIISGAQPYETVKGVVEGLLKQVAD